MIRYSLFNGQEYTEAGWIVYSFICCSLLLDAPRREKFQLFLFPLTSEK